MKWTKINYADFGPQCTCTKNCTDPVFGVITNLCTPQMSLRSQLTQLDPAWATCIVDAIGVFDPPVALTQAAGLKAPETTSAPPIQPDPSPTPIPVQSPSQPLATTTTVPQPTDTPTSSISFVIRSTATASGTPDPISGRQTTSQDLVPTAILFPTSLVTTNSEGLYVIGIITITPPANPTPTPPPITIDGQTVTANSQGLYVIGTQAITPGLGPITVDQPAIIIDGLTVTANLSGNYIIGTQIITPGTGPVTLYEAPIAIGGQIYTANTKGEYVIAGQTLVPGGSAVKIDETTVSLGLGTSGIVIIGPSGTSTRALGSVIMSFIGGVPTETSLNGPAQYTGGANKMFGVGGFCEVAGIVGVIGGFLVM